MAQIDNTKTLSHTVDQKNTVLQVNLLKLKIRSTLSHLTNVLKATMPSTSASQ